jgi:hypothetical protein
MRLACSCFRRLAGWVALVALITVWTGCAANRINWPSRVGNYTFDQAVLELGPPARSARLTDGTMVADWQTQRSQVIVFNNGPYYPYGPVLAPTGPTVSAINTPAYYLRLTFDPAGKLKTWKNFAR